MSQYLLTLFSPEALSHLADVRSFERGTEYAAGGAVRDLRLGDESVTATVTGTKPYGVRLWIESGGPGFECTCPVGEEEGFCKHCVAVGLVLAAEGTAPVRKGKRPKTASRPQDAETSVRAYLLSLKKAQLIDLVVAAAEQDDLLRGRLLVDAADRSGSGLDVEIHRSAIERAIDAGEFVDYHQMYGYAQGIERVVDSLQALLVAGHAPEVVELCEYAMAYLEDALGHVDDSDGYLGEIRDRLGGLHHSACVAAKLNPVELAKRLFQWELHSEWDGFYGAAATYADVFGKAGLAEYRRLGEEMWSRVPALGPGDDRDSDEGFRFRITHIMEALAELSGDLDELVEVKARDLSSAYSFVVIAEDLVKAGRHDDALAWAERGVKAFPVRTDNRLREILAEEYQRRERHDEARELMWAAFEERPGLDTYKRLADRANRTDRWQEWRAKALKKLRANASAPVRTPRTSRARAYGQWSEDRSELVEVFLWEGDVETAWQEAVAGGCSPALWLELAGRRERDRPDEVIPVYQREIERVIDQKDNRSYEEAVRLLRKVRALMVRAGKEPEFAPYAAGVRATHKPKRNLMKLFDKAGW